MENFHSKIYLCEIKTKTAIKRKLVNLVTCQNMTTLQMLNYVIFLKMCKWKGRQEV